MTTANGDLPQGPDDEGPAGPRSRGRRARRRIVPRVLLALVALVVLLLVWSAVRGYQAYAALSAARADAQRVQDSLTSGRQAPAEQAAAALSTHAARARSAMADPVFTLAGWLPAVGYDVRAVRVVADNIDLAARGVLSPLVGVADALRPSSLRASGSGVNIQLLAKAAPTISAAADNARAVDAALAGIDTHRLVGPLRTQVENLRTLTHRLATQTHEAAVAARVLPSMLGGQGTRRYFLAFQNLAEARGTGGLVGAYGILEASDGRVRLTHLGSNTELRNADAVPVDLGKDYADLYGDDPAWWVNANMSAHFPYAAKIWLALWQRQHDERLDGVIATDPVALGYLLGATGPAPIPGGQLSAANAADLTMRQVYAKFPGTSGAENAVRDLYLGQLAKAAFDKITSGAGNARALVTALGRAAGEHRLMVYSAHPDEQRELETTPVAGALPDGPDPFVAVVVNNGAGSKMDYYLRRDVRYEQVGCAAGERRTKVTVTLSSDAPTSGLPAYVTPRQDAEGRGGRTAVGSNYSLLNIYTTRGARLLSATLDHSPHLVRVGSELGHPVFGTQMEIVPGQTRTLVLDLVEPIASPTAPAPDPVWVQPAVRVPYINFSLTACPSGNK